MSVQLISHNISQVICKFAIKKERKCHHLCSFLLVLSFPIRHGRRTSKKPKAGRSYSSSKDMSKDSPTDPQDSLLNPKVSAKNRSEPSLASFPATRASRIAWLGISSDTYPNSPHKSSITPARDDFTFVSRGGL